MKYPLRMMSGLPRTGYVLIPIAIGLLLSTPASQAMTDQVPREQDIVDLRLGQRITVDDGTCPAGQIKEVSGAKMSPNGIVRAKQCISRTGPKKK